ncbi:MAG: hypothetical protein WC523_04935 [Patescibacteria group bacterium]
MADEEKECAWNLGTSHEGVVTNTKLWDGQILVPVCEKHLKEHKIIIALFQAGQDIEELFTKTEEWRENEYNILVANGTIYPSNLSY